jgi:hypothetical protein
MKGHKDGFKRGGGGNGEIMGAFAYHSDEWVVPQAFGQKPVMLD